VVVDLSGPWTAGPDATADAARRALQPLGDIHATAEYRRHLAGVLTLRAIRAALDRAGAVAA
jgi:carbon-monoxide dehydrogenase medium subunit